MDVAEATLESVRPYLEHPRCAVVATVAPDGSPHQAVVHYWLEGDALLLNGREDRRWLQNVRRDGRLSLVVHDAERTQHWVAVKGRARVEREGRGAVEDAIALAHRYGEDGAPYERQRRVTLLVVPRRVLEYG